MTTDLIELFKAVERDTLEAKRRERYEYLEERRQERARAKAEKHRLAHRAEHALNH